MITGATQQCEHITVPNEGVAGFMYSSGRTGNLKSLRKAYCTALDPQKKKGGKQMNSGYNYTIKSPNDNFYFDDRSTIRVQVKNPKGSIDQFKVTFNFAGSSDYVESDPVTITVSKDPYRYFNYENAFHSSTIFIDLSFNVN